MKLPEVDRDNRTTTNDVQTNRTHTMIHIHIHIHKIHIHIQERTYIMTVHSRCDKREHDSYISIIAICCVINKHLFSSRPIASLFACRTVTLISVTLSRHFACRTVTLISVTLSRHFACRTVTLISVNQVHSIRCMKVMCSYFNTH